ncbi:ribonuclease III [Candidatus Fermentibacteria bacterium]|nr:ribonuclease III [Candidatus Fermentibacteria bacterium]
MQAGNPTGGADASSSDASRLTPRERTAVQHAEECIGYRFSSAPLLRRALTHRSYAHEHSVGDHNERLELLGDAVIGLVVTEDIFNRFAGMGEGELTQLKSFLVSRRLQARAAKGIGLDECMLVGSSEERSGIRARLSTLANLFEAAVGALYLDGGLDAAAAFLQRVILSQAQARAPSSFDLKDPKTSLQELVQGREPIQPEYRLIAVSGPDHLPTFTVEVRIGKETLAQGSGGSKKDAEREAARNALTRLSANLPARAGDGEPDR